MVNNYLVKNLFLVCLFALIPAFAKAVVITLEPDDYGLGVPLQNAYVTTAGLDGHYEDDPWGTPLTAVDIANRNPEYSAPTGKLTFGSGHPFRYPSPEAGRNGYTGFGIKFNQAVSHVTLLANSQYQGGFHLSAVWLAFDREGNQIAYGGASAKEGEPYNATFEIDIRQEGIWSLILGGDTEIASMYFDHLTFELPDASVPAPNPLILFAIGVAMILLGARLKTPSRN